MYTFLKQIITRKKNHFLSAIYEYVEGEEYLKYIYLFLVKTRIMKYRGNTYAGIL